MDNYKCFGFLLFKQRDIEVSVLKKKFLSKKQYMKTTSRPETDAEIMKRISYAFSSPKCENLQIINFQKVYVPLLMSEWREEIIVWVTQDKNIKKSEDLLSLENPFCTE